MPGTKRGTKSQRQRWLEEGIRQARVARRARLPPFLCPYCGRKTIQVETKKNFILVACQNKHLTEILDREDWMEPVDAYCIAMDKYYERMGIVAEVKLVVG